jgi:hypothetical protein
MNDIQLLHQKAIEFAEQAGVVKLRGAALVSDRSSSIEQIQQLLRSAFEQESQAAALVVDVADAEPTRSMLHRSAAALAIDCGNCKRRND